MIQAGSGSYTSQRRVDVRLNRLGYWLGPDESGWPDPRLFVDNAWDADECAEVALHLWQGIIARRYMGLSKCRFCGAPNGALELSDGVYIWPEGLAHYVEEHGVRLPQRFVHHVNALQDSLEDAVVDDEWWRSLTSWYERSTPVTGNGT